MSTHYTHFDYGQLTLAGAGTAASHDTLAELTDFDVQAMSPAAKITAAHATGLITVSEAGFYRLDFQGAFLGSNGKDIVVAFYNGATVVPGASKQLYALTGVLLPIAVLETTIWCEPGAVLTVQTNAGDATNWTPTDLSFTVTRVG